jgi:hypothetical protein
MRGEVITISRDHGSDHDQGEEAPSGTSHQEGSSADSIEEEDGWKGEDRVGDTVDSSG